MSRGLKSWKPILHLLFIILVSYLISLRSLQKVNMRKILKFRSDMRHILLWTKIPGLETDGQDVFVKKKCQYFNCYIVSNRTFFDNLGHYDAILFNLQDVSSSSRELPTVRSWTQKYIFVANDSSDNYPVCDPFFDTFFNWTWSYKQDSTIAYRYITYRNKNDEVLRSRFKWITQMTPINSLLRGQLSSKYKAAAIFMDKCKSRSKREMYVKNLQRHLSKFNLTVDVFGECGSKKCKRKTMKNCFWRLKNQYHFYLAMEDSFAVDYMTNEVLYAYENFAVPIVYGGADYAEYLPPNSYRDAKKLDEETMATAIHDAMKNKTVYHDYFRWRNHYRIQRAPGMEPCSLCKALNNQHWLKYHTSHKSFRKWWNPNYKTRCAKHLGIPLW